MTDEREPESQNENSQPSGEHVNPPREIQGPASRESNPLWKEFIGEKVVIDTPTPYVYLGTLVEQQHGALVLENVDVHDSKESESTKEVYIMKAADQGIRVNRKRVMVPAHRVLSISRLEDTVVY